MKKRFQRILSVLLCCLLVFGAAPLSVFGGLPAAKPGFWSGVSGKLSALWSSLSSLSMRASAADDWSFDETTGVLTIRTVGEMGNYSYSNQPWYSYRSAIRKVVIGAETTTIGKYAFYNYPALETVEIADSVTQIGGYAFADCGKLVIDQLPPALTTLDGYAFRNCTSITEIYIPRSLTQVNSVGAFNGCASLGSVSFEEGATEVVNYLFKDCTGLKHIDIPDTVTAIEGAAFSGAVHLESVNFPLALASIGSSAFAGCTALQAIELKDYVTEIGSGAFRNCTAVETLRLSKRIDYIGERAFENCDGLTEIVIPASLTRAGSSYGDGIITGCDNLKKAVFADGMIRVPDHIFGRSPGLEEVVLPDTVTDIGSYAFAYCDKLVIDHLPPKLVGLGGFAFRSCLSITEMYIPKSLHDTGYTANGRWGPFDGCENLETVSFEEGTTWVSQYLFDSCTGLRHIDIPDTVTAIEPAAFNGAVNLESVTFPSPLASIGSSAFSGCTALQAIELKDYVTEIEGSAFSNCTAAETLRLSKRINYIGHSAFYNCDGLTEVEIPGSLTRTGFSSNSHGIFERCDNLKKAVFTGYRNDVPDGIFAGCTGLEEVVLPETVRSIGHYAFNATRLNTINLPDNLQTIGKWSFENTRLVNVVIPDKATSVGEGAFAGCDLLRSIVLPKGLSKIERYLFDGCTSLKTVNIPTPVQTIGDYAFRKTALESVRIENAVSSVGEYAFYDCDALVSVTLSPDVKSIGRYSFAFCEKLKDITINTNTITNEGTTVIAKGAFTDSPSLEVVVLPKCVKELESDAFHNCPRLREITIPITVGIIADTAFSYPDRMIIKGVKGTAAEVYANVFEYEFVDISKPITGLVLKDNAENKLSMLKGSYCTPEFDYFPEDTTDLIVLTTADAYIAFITDYRIYGNTEGATTITATASSGLTYDFTVNVTTVDSIEVTSLPTKTVYEYGQPFDAEGLVVTAYFSDGSANPVVDYTLSGYNAETYGKQTITVTYGGKKATFEVEVLDDRVFVEGIEITTLPDKLTYKKGENLITDGMIVTAAYSDGTFAAVTGYTTSAINVLKPGKQTVTVTYEGFTDTFEVEVVDFYVTGVAIESLPLKTEYFVGDPLNTEGLSVRVTYSDDTEEIHASGFTCTPDKFDVAGSQKITVRYVDAETSFTVHVANVEVEAVTVTSPPDKTTYYVGDTLNTRGLKLTLRYNNGKIETVTNGFTCTPKLLSDPGTQKITVAYDGVTASFNVAVLEVVIENLEIRTMPRKTIYFTGNRLDMTGFELTATYNNGTTETVTKGYTYTPDVLTTEGKTTVTVIYKGKTVSFDVTVRAKAIDSISVNTMPDKTTYNIGSTLDTSGMSIRVQYNDGSYEIVNEGLTCTPVKLETAGTQTVQVTYKGFAASFEVAVNSFNTSSRFWFSNSRTHFMTSWSGGSYYMTDEDMTKLVNYIKKIYTSPSATISNMQNIRYSSWGGSCYGMAAAAVLDFNDQIAFNENYGNRAATMHDVKSPSTSKTIMSAINYYMVSQAIPYLRSYDHFYYNYYSDWSNGLRDLVEYAKKGQPFLFSYWFSSGGHTIVAYGYEEGAGGTHNILTYDNRYPTDTVTIAVDANYTSCTVKSPYANESCRAIEFYEDMTAFDRIDIDGPNNDFVIRHSGAAETDDSTYIYITADDTVTATNEKGETIRVTADSVSGSMEILSTHMIVNSTEDGDPAPVTMVFEVDGSSDYSFTSTADHNAEVAVKTPGMYAACTFASGSEVTIADGQGIFIEGEKAAYTASLSSVNHDYDTVSLAGTVDGKTALVYSGSNISAEGVNEKTDSITVYSHINDVDTIAPPEDAGDVVVRADGNVFVAEEISKLHTITWNVDGSKTVAELNAGSPITKPADPAKTGYAFDGWSPEVPDTMPDADLEFVAGFTPVTYYATFTADGKQVGDKIAFTVESTSITEPAVPEKDGYTGKWSAYTLTADNITVTAVYTKIANPTANAVIHVAGSVAVDYKTIVTIKAMATDLDPAYHLVLVIDGKEIAGSNTEVSYEYGALTKDLNYAVRIVDDAGNVQKDKNGNALQKEGGKIVCNDGFVKKIKAFFMALFGIKQRVEVKP